jgi:glycerophosphoryl diester phosphodiesterase
VEIKCGPEILDELERTLLQRKREQRRLVLIGFSIDTLQEAKRRFPGVPVYWLVDFSKDHRIGKVPDVESLIRETAAAGLDGLNVKSKGFVDAEFVRKIKAAGLRLFVWTVDAPSTAKRLAAAGVDGITTNRPAKLIAELKGEK